MITDQTGGERGDTLDVTLAAVADEERRAVLRTLNAADEEALAIETLADRVADRVGDDRPTEEDPTERIHTALHHTHLPKLDEGGLVFYDADRKQVRKARDHLGDRLLAAIEGHDAVE